MQRFIGTKIIEAQPMTHGAYNEYRGWTIPANENPADPGYLVKYQDGYISWTPKAQFDDAYRPCTAMTFGLALEALKRGAKVARAGWNGAGQWVALGEGRNVWPDDFWNEHTRAFAHQKANNTPAGGDVTTFVRPYFILKTAQNDILMGWTPSQSDALAEDWQIVE